MEQNVDRMQSTLQKLNGLPSQEQHMFPPMYHLYHLYHL